MITHATEGRDQRTPAPGGARAAEAERDPRDVVEPVRVLVADPDALARQLLHRALEGHPDLRVVSDAGDGWEAVQLASFYRPRVLIVDAAVPRVDVIDVVREVARVLPATRTVILSASDDEQLAVDALSAGAVGYLTKDLQPAALPDMVRKVARGEPLVPASLIPRLLERLREMPDAGWRPMRSRLTTREWEIVDLIAGGATTNEIARQLFLSAATVYSHIKSLMRKLDVHSRREAVAAAGELRREEVARPPGPGLTAAPT